MPRPTLEIGIVTDEVSRDLEQAFALSRSWGVSRFELREGSERRFPALTREEIALVDEQVREGALITAVSPGILKGNVEDESLLRSELEDVLPRAIELGKRFECPMIIVFGFERNPEETRDARARAMHAFERAAETAGAAGMTVAIENEPNFWIDRPRDEAAMLEEIDHPALKANWDPANAHWGGYLPTHDDFLVLAPHIANLHVKDFDPYRLDAPWKPVGQGRTPWRDILRWVDADTELTHLTIETHCLPLEESSRASIEWVRSFLAEIEAER